MRRKRKPAATPIIKGFVAIFFRIDLMLNFRPSSLIKIESEIMAKTLKRGIDIEEIIDAITSVVGSLSLIDMAREIPMIA